MKIVIVTLLITIPTLLFAEKKTIIEPAIMECQYDHIIVQDTLNRSHVMKDRMILRIGKNVSQFYSWYTLQGDSMWTDPRGRKIAAERIFEALRTQNHENIIGERTDGYIYHSYPQKGITTTYTSQGGEDMRTPVTFLYFSEETPRQEWKIQDSVKQVLRYTCQLATAQFRGRLWYAWFTPDIPIDNGPWKLSGLPGLIVEAYDSQNYYYYTLTGIQTKNCNPLLSTIIGKKYSKKPLDLITLKKRINHKLNMLTSLDIQTTIF